MQLVPVLPFSDITICIACKSPVRLFRAAALSEWRGGGAQFLCFIVEVAVVVVHGKRPPNHIHVKCAKAAAITIKQGN